VIPADALRLRPMETGDLPAVLAFAHAQGRNVHHEEYARFLALEGAQGFVLSGEGGALTGAITAIRYFEQGFVGPVLTPPGADGLAIALLAHAIEGLQRGGAGLLECESTDEEAAILQRMGFRAERTTLVLEREARAGGAQPVSAAMTPGDFLDLGALDGAAFGIGRKEYLYALMQDFPQGARTLHEAGEVRGYAFLRRSRRGYHLGPMVTREDDPEAARLLLDDAVGLAAGWPLVALSPESSPLLPELERHGFARVGRLTRMRAGAPGRDVGSEARATEWLVGSRITG
jgi:hypothetical protein